MINKTNLSFLLSFLALSTAAQQHYLLAGTYTSGKSEGIYVYRFNSNDATVTAVSYIKISNPSYLTVSPDEKYVYAVKENSNNKGGGGSIAAFSFSKETGKLTLLNEQLSGGDDPCYISTNKTGKWVVAGNYSSGSLAVFRVRPDGSVGAATTRIQHTGSGPNLQRQEKAHVHCTLFSNDDRYLYVPDLGTDKVMIYSFDAVNGNLTPAPQPFVGSVAGAGPRHICFHPLNRTAYLIEELGGTVVVFKNNHGLLTQVQRIHTLPDTSMAGSADIHVSPDGRFLYASNRANSNTITIFKIDRSNGMLVRAGQQSTLGRTPRNFTLDPSGNFLLVANQNSDEVVIFKRDKNTGMLTDTKKRIAVGNPVCLKWISIK